MKLGIKSDVFDVVFDADDVILTKLKFDVCEAAGCFGDMSCMYTQNEET